MKYLLLSAVSLGLVAAQPNVCTTTATPTLVRSEGLTERVGDILYTCTGAPGSTFSINLSVQLNTEITNRLSTGNTITGTILTYDNGSGYQPILTPPILQSQNNIIWNGITFVYSPQGTLSIKIADIRANAAGIGPGGEIFANLAMSAGSLLINQTSLVVGVPETSLYAGFSANLVCAQYGSPLPGTFTFLNMLQGGTAFTSTRITEGFASAFSSKSQPPNLNADTGTRFIVRYAGFPAAARLFIPTVVAGSDAVTPTGGGDFGVAPSGGAYAPTTQGSLLLALVPSADSNGAGGSPVYTPAAVGSGTDTFDAVTELTLVNGAAYAVYEVVDANATALETAQFPTFLGLAPNAVQTAVSTAESVTYAPVSGVFNASASAPIPRFGAFTPGNDCSVIGDCGANYFPQLTVDNPTLNFTLTAGALNETLGVPVHNSGGGVLYWTAAVSYINGSGWLHLDAPYGTNNGSIRVDANALNLGVGTYQALLTVDAGSAGRRVVTVTLVVTQAVAPGPQISSVLNAASFTQVPVVAGSLTTIMGSAFTGKLIGATFDGLPATILFSNDTQINLLVPSGLGAKTSTQLFVTVDGKTSAPLTVQAAPFEPGIFPGAVANQDGTLNSVSAGAATGSVIYFYATGLSGVGTISAKIGNTELTNLYYAGPAPGYPGVQQINLTIPPGFSGTTQLSACGTTAGTEVCSLPVPITVK